MKRKYVLYEKSTGKARWSELMDEQDVLETPEDYIVFKSKEELEEWKNNKTIQSPVTPVETVLKENMNTKEETEVKTESTVEVSVEKTEWGGKRNGAGTKKGYQQSQEHRDRRIAALRESAQRRRKAASGY